MARPMTRQEFRREMRNYGYDRVSPLDGLITLIFRLLVVAVIVGVFLAITHPTAEQGHDSRPATTVTHAPIGGAK
ncbi:hypothetical protein KGQ20_39520 [Catenulispora sp. NF23]|uniref:hypothetical protein n=1 Tax=Catenulispora pinistramenti TaxID=2705254 RepID=UPI001BA801A1|nr:hypothetical protein [Catenulispora pinistramenti]MBS2538854.1 hypothetical protein [Catenulispora pinistramenti]